MARKTLEVVPACFQFKVCISYDVKRTLSGVLLNTVENSALRWDSRLPATRGIHCEGSIILDTLVREPD
jgi:hypothetical protein